MGVTTRQSLWIIQCVSLMIAVASFVPWFDFHTNRIAGDDPLVAWRFGNAWLLGVFALASAVLAWWMICDASELVWALLVATCTGTFVVAAGDLTASYPSCGTVLGFLSFVCSIGSKTIWLLGGEISTFLWVLAMTSLIIALMALCLPIIETMDRSRTVEGD